MMDERILSASLNSLKQPFVFVDTEHIIQYMNKAAIDSYKGRPAEVGRSIFDCHNERSKQVILDVFECLVKGEDEKMIADSETQRVFMRAVRDKEGNLIGYFERFELPGKSV